MSFRGRVLAALGLVGLLAGPGLAGEEDVVERSARVRAAFPAPAVERGFSFPFVMMLKGARVGTGRFTAVPGALEGKAAWKVAERVDSQAAGMSYEATGWLGPDLRLLRWESVQKGPEGRTILVRPGEDGLVRTVKSGEEEETEPVEVDGSATAGFVGVLLFIRSAPPSTDGYGLYLADGPRVEVVALVHVGEGRFEDGTASVAARVTRGKRGDLPLEVFQGAQSGDVLAIRIAEKEVAFVRDDLFGPKRKIDFSRSATTARAAAGRFLLGVLAGDRKLTEASIHWPSFFRPLRELAEAAGKRYDEAAARRDFLDQMGEAGAKLRASATPPTREQVEALLEAGLEKATEVVQPDGNTLVTVDDPFPKPMSVPVRKVGAAWFVVGFPRR